jgi:CRISPR/Cas system CSM-associated protein Csm4 (group 5 of RAMP superfamily)
VKQIYLKPRGPFRAPPRSDTLFGLLAHAVRAVYGRASVERFLAPAFESPANAPLYVTSAFPWIETEKGRLHFFPAPLSQGGRGFVEDADFLGYVAGHKTTIDPSPLADGLVTRDHDRDGDRAAMPRGGFFFLAAGPAEHYLEAALHYLERSGFGGGASHGLSHFDVELTETEFVRLAQPGERGVLLSLAKPTADERELLAREARTDSRLAWRVERRQGYAGQTFVTGETPRKRAIAMFTEGSVLVRGPGRACGSAPVVAEGRDAAGAFPIVHSGFGFLVPLLGKNAGAAA